MCPPLETNLSAANTYRNVETYRNEYPLRLRVPAVRGARDAKELFGGGWSHRSHAARRQDFLSARACGAGRARPADPAGDFPAPDAARTGGLAAGAIADAIGCPHNTLSSHLGILARAGLVRGTRDGKSIIYRADVEGMRALGRLPGHRLLRWPPGDSAIFRARCARPPAPRPHRRATNAGHSRCADTVDRPAVQRPLSLHRQLGALDHGRGHPWSRRTWQFPRFLGRQPAEGQRPSLCARSLAQVELRRQRLPLQELERVRPPRRAQARFRLHGLRRCGGGGLPGMAGPADDRALGHSRSGRGHRQRGRNASRFRRRVPNAQQSHLHLRQPADPLARQAGAAEAFGFHRQDFKERPRTPPRRRRPPAE